MKNIPGIIYLQVGEFIDDQTDFSDLEEVTWCDTNQFDTDIVYLRSEAAELRRKELEQKAYTTGKNVGELRAYKEVLKLIEDGKSLQEIEDFLNLSLTP